MTSWLSKATFALKFMILIGLNILFIYFVIDAQQGHHPLAGLFTGLIGVKRRIRGFCSDLYRQNAVIRSEPFISPQVHAQVLKRTDAGTAEVPASFLPGSSIF